jgi:MoaA/NifB/PqqE/SkfB family radical SAM enzyme
MTDDALRFLADLGVQVMFSLPGLETYAEHTGGESPDRVLSLFERAARLGLTTTVGVTVTRWNLYEVYSTIGEAFLAGASELLLNRLLPGGRGLTRWRDLALDRDETAQMLGEAEAALRASGRWGQRAVRAMLMRPFGDLPAAVLDAAARRGRADDMTVVALRPLRG